MVSPQILTKAMTRRQKAQVMPRCWDHQTQVVADEFGTALNNKHYNETVRLLYHIDKADAVVANCAPFRGQCVDDGTAFELGVAFAKGVPIVAYTPHAETTVKDRLDAAFADPSLAALYDQETFPRSEDFPGANDAVDALQRPGPVNIMITEAIRKQGGFIGGSFEECLVHLQGLGRQEGERE